MSYTERVKQASNAWTNVIRLQPGIKRLYGSVAWLGISQLMVGANYGSARLWGAADLIIP